jgi:ferredoxin
MNIKTAIVPFSCFDELKQDFAEFSKREDINGYQKWITTELYVLDPKLDFTPQSIIITVTPKAFKKAEFTYKGKKYSSLLVDNIASDEIVRYLSQGNSYKFFYDYRLPAKRTAVRSGLCEYGRNNICYAGGYGSLIEICVFISDMPCPESYVWREVKNMDICEGCNLCEKSCTTGAVKPGRFLLDNSLCLTCYNENSEPNYPDFVPETAQRNLVNCFFCQEVCPMNRGKFDNINEMTAFDDEETSLLLDGVKLEELPPQLSAKVHACNMEWFYYVLPKNLKALIKAADLRADNKL